MSIEKPITRPCMTCESGETIRGLECPRCNAISIVSSVIWSHYDGREANDLAEALSEQSVAGFRQTARDRRAGMMLRIADAIDRAAFAANIDADGLRLSVVRAIKKHLAHCKAVRDYEVQHGMPGGYRQRIIDHHIPEWQKIMHGKADQECYPKTTGAATTLSIQTRTTTTRTSATTG